MLVAGWAAAEWAFGLACAAHPRRHVVARCGRGRTGWQRGRLNGQDARMPWWAVARWSWWERVCDAGTMRVGGGTGRSSPSVAFLRHWAADHWSNGSTGFWRQFGSSAQDDEHIGAGARRGAGLRDLAYRVSKLFSQPCVRLVALRVLWTARAARRPFLFWIGRRARSGCAGPPGPRPLAPPRMRPSESGWDDDDSTGHRGGELRR